MKHLVIAVYKENTDWLTEVVTHAPIIIRKQTEEHDGDMPNEGREPASFCLAIIRHYDQIKPSDEWAFVQGNPFDHCLDFWALLNKSTNGFRWLGGNLKYSDGQGRHDHGNLPVAEKYKQWLGHDWPDDYYQVDFAPGGQFVVTGKELLAHPKSFYKMLLKDVCIDWNAWVAERLWGKIFNAQEATTLVQ